MISAAFEANSLASSALSIQSFVAAEQSVAISLQSLVAAEQSVALSLQSLVAAKQSVALDVLNSRIGAIGQLWLLDFCLGNTVRETCILCGSKLN